MANIKIAELQSSLLEEVSARDWEAVHGGQGTQVVGATSGVGITFTNGGSAGVTTGSESLLTGTLAAFRLDFRTFSNGSTFPR